MNKAGRKAQANRILMQKVLELLVQNPTGLTAQEIVDKTNVNRQAVTKALSTLKTKNEVGREELHWKLDKYVTKSELLYPNFEEEHKQWIKEASSKEVKFNPHERN